MSLIGHIDGVWISKAEHLEQIMIRIAERCGFTIVSRAFHQFEPHGASGVLLLNKSHFSAHTYPDQNRVYIDVFCSSDFCSYVIEEEFSALNGTWKVISRVT